jgi:type II secretory pathway component PulF
MPLFTFEAVDAAGTRVRGTESASTAAVLTTTLEARGLHLLAAREADTGNGWAWSFGHRRDVLEFTRAMAALLPAGMPLARALESAAGVTRPAVRQAVLDVKARVVRGDPLAVALEAVPNCFSPLYCGIVRAGERSGDLDGAFARLAVQLDREEQLRGRVLTATLYPVLLAVAGACAVGVLLLVVLPQFTTLLADAGAALPRSTQVLVATSNALTRLWPVAAGGAMALVASLVWMQQTADGRRVRARLLLSVPLVRTLRRQIIGARMARLLAALLGGGAPLYTALGDVVESLDDPVARDETILVRQRVREGASLKSAIAASPLFPPVLAQLVGVGEESSQLRAFLFTAADILDERAERTAQRVATLAEPTLIVVFGAVVALIAFALLQAIYGINAGSFVR